MHVSCAKIGGWPVGGQRRDASKSVTSAASAARKQRDITRRLERGGGWPTGGTAASGSSSRQRVAVAAGSSQEALLQQPALVLAGFYLEELATVRQLLDQVGGEGVKVVPTTPALLHAPLAAALAASELAWDQPTPADLQHGGGWGQQRMVVMSGLSGEQGQTIVAMLDEVDLSPVCPALATPDNLQAPLGEVLAAALRQWRQGPPPPPPRAGAAAPAAAQAGPAAEPAAAATPAAASPAAEPRVAFVEDLPAVEAVVPEEVWLPQAAQQHKQQRLQRAGAQAGASDGASGSAGPTSSSSEVLQAEFTECAPAQQPPAGAVAAPSPGSRRQQGAEELPLDVIDAIARGREGSGGGLNQEEEAELAAARVALGLDSATGQGFMEGVVAKAAEAMSVPFVTGNGGGATSSTTASQNGSSTGSGGGGSSSNGSGPALRPGSFPPRRGSKKPWEAGAPAAPGQPAAGSAATAGTAAAEAAAPAPFPSKGFGTSVPNRAGQSGKKGGRRGSSSSGGGTSSAGVEQPSTASSVSGAALDDSSSRSGNNSGSAASKASAGASEASRGAAGDEEAPAAPEGNIIPPVEAFVLSKAQLRGVAERHGLDFQEMLAGLEQRGISLAD